jgi:hypothetical protein
MISVTDKGGPVESPIAEGKRHARTALQLSNAMDRISKKIKRMKPEKSPGPPPFDKLTAERYEVRYPLYLSLLLALVSVMT